MTDTSTAAARDPLRLLCLDGGGAKGFYTLGVLHELEGLIGARLHTRFDLVFGTSTGAIIAALVALGYSVADIHALYKEHVPRVTRAGSARARSLPPWPISRAKSLAIRISACSKLAWALSPPSGSPRRR